MALTLRDIAEMVGVAESTVSRAINNKPGVGASTRKRIMEIVDKYNYRPNQLARGLAKQETRILALMLPDLAGTSYLQIMKSVESVANDNGYQVVICNTDNDLQKERAYLDLLERNRVDGAIIAGGNLADEQIVNTFLRGDNLLVLINRLTEETLIPTVLVDKAHGAYLAVEHLLQQKVKKIALVMGQRNEYNESEKLAGYRKALREYGLEVDQKYIFTTESGRKGGYKSFLRAMDLAEPPRAFFVTGELAAVGLVEAIKMGGYLIPDDFPVVSYGKSILTSVVEPSLSVVAEPLSEMGKIAAEHLFTLINGENPEEMIKVLDPELEIGESSRPGIIN